MNEEINKLIEEFETRLKVMKEEYNQDWNAEYFYIASTGDIYSNHWVQDESDTKSYEIGNVFKTKEEALFEVEKRKVLHELKQLGREFILDHDNWLFYLKGNQEIDCTAYQNIQFPQGSLYFDTESELWEAINTVGLQRIKKYLFGIEG